jgi:pyruvate kinase
MGAMIDAGMDIARLDFSWGDHKSWGKSIEKLKEALKARPGKHCPILMDIKGIEVKTSVTREHKPIDLKLNQELEICNDPSYEADEKKFGCSLKTLHHSVKPGTIIWLDKNKMLKAKVTKILDDSIKVQVL